MKRLYRSTKDKVFCGVCGGIAEYLNVDPVIIRLAAIALFIINPAATILLYIAACIVMPEHPQGEKTPSIEEGIRREVKRVVEEIRREIISEKEARNIKIAVGLALMVLGAVMITSTIWSNIVDVLRNLWVFMAGYYKIVAGIILLAIGLAIIVLATSKSSREK